MEYKLSINNSLHPQFDNELNMIWPENAVYSKENLNCYFKQLTKNIPVDDKLSEWKLHTTIFLGGIFNSKSILIIKRGVVYPAQKIKEITIHITLPTREEAFWGISERTRFNEYIKDYKKHSHVLPVDYQKFESLTEYIQESTKTALAFIFRKGIAINGQKIKKYKADFANSAVL